MRKPDADRALAQLRRNQYHHSMRQERLGGPMEYDQLVTARRLNDAPHSVAVGVETLMHKLLREAGGVLAGLRDTASTTHPLPAEPGPFREGT